MKSKALFFSEIKIVLIFALFFSFSFDAFSQHRGSHLPMRVPGKCYAKAFIPSEYEYFEVDYPVYIGENPEALATILDTILINEHEKNRPSTKWAKRKADRYCISSDPDDCLVWCLVEVSFEPEYIVIVTDTTATTDFIYETYTFSNEIRQGGFTEWIEVICGDLW